MNLSELKNPTEWLQIPFEYVEFYRFLDCIYYGECLNYSALMKWESFSCTNCKINKLKEIEKGKENET